VYAGTLIGEGGAGAHDGWKAVAVGARGVKGMPPERGGDEDREALRPRSGRLFVKDDADDDRT